MTRRHPAGCGDLLDLGFDLARGRGGSCRGPGARPGSSAGGRPWRGSGRSRGPGGRGRSGEWVRITRRVRRKRGGGAVDRGQPAEPGLINDLVAAAGHGQQVRVLGGRQRPDVVQAGPARWPGWRPSLCPASKTTVSLPRTPPASCLVAGDQLVDHGGELGDVGPVARVGVRDQRDPAVAGDHQAPARPAAGRGVSAWPCRAARSAPSRCRSR